MGFVELLRHVGGDCVGWIGAGANVAVNEKMIASKHV